METEEIKKLELQAIDLHNAIMIAANKVGRGDLGRALSIAGTSAESTTLRIQTLHDGGLVTVRPPRNN